MHNVRPPLNFKSIINKTSVPEILGTSLVTVFLFVTLVLGMLCYAMRGYAILCHEGVWYAMPFITAHDILALLRCDDAMITSPSYDHVMS